MTIMGRQPILTPIPSHPSIPDETVVHVKVGGHMGPCMEVVCPFCKIPRWIPYRILRHQIVKSHWTGACKSCWSSQPKARNYRTKRNPSGRRMSGDYVALGKNAITDEELEMFNAMIGKSGYVLEHRWVMAKYLGRPLSSKELVDHKNGVTTDNSIENLRIYVKGKQQPGSATGHGTYYHEWQMAERRIRELEGRL